MSFINSGCQDQQVLTAKAEDYGRQDTTGISGSGGYEYEERSQVEERTVAAGGVPRQPILPGASIGFAGLTPCLTVDSALYRYDNFVINATTIFCRATITFAGLIRPLPADSAPSQSDSWADRTPV